MLHDNSTHEPVPAWIGGLDLNNVGFAIVGLFLLTWLGAVGYWKVGGVEKRWATAVEA